MTIALLTNLEWSFLSPQRALAARGGKADEVALREMLRSELQKRTFIFRGKNYPLSEKAIDNLIAEVCSLTLNEDLLTANERLSPSISRSSH